MSAVEALLQHGAEITNNCKKNAKGKKCKQKISQAIVKMVGTSNFGTYLGSQDTLITFYYIKFGA